MKDQNVELKVFGFFVGLCLFYPAALLRIALIQWVWVAFCAEWVGVAELPSRPVYGCVFIIQAALVGLYNAKPEDQKGDFEKDAPTIFLSLHSMTLTSLSWGMAWVFSKLL